MGYTTDFTGKFEITPVLKPEDKEFLTKLAETRRVKRNLGPEFGVDGDFYVEDDEKGIVNYNAPPFTQPELWLQWIPTEDGKYLVWDGGEKFYSYVPWVKYLIAKILKPRGYVLNGRVEWDGEEQGDTGTIVVKENVVTTSQGLRI